MKINLNKQDKILFKNLLDQKDINIGVADLLNDICFSYEEFPELEDMNNPTSKDIANMIISHCELEDQEDILFPAIKDSFSIINYKEYNDNPFNKLAIKPISWNGYKLEYLSYPKNTLFPLDEIAVNEKENYKEISNLGISKDEYSFLALTKNQNIWMLITPNEINTMEPYIKEAKGKVIVFGLGLGYISYMLSNKSNVSEVTIIEKDENIINIFKKNILPTFSNKNKIHIVKYDGFNFLKGNDLHTFDYAFFDLWHNAEDGLPMYLKIKSFPIKITCGFWLEKSIKALYRRCLLTLIEEALDNKEESNYLKAKNDIDKVINDLYFKHKNTVINSYNDILKLLDF